MAFKALLLSLSAASIAGLWYASPIVKPFPELTGDYQVGTKTVYFTDQQRTEQFSNNSTEKRFLVGHIFYPADVSSDAQKASYLGDKMPFFQRGVAAHFGVPEFLVKMLFRDIKIQAYTEVPVSAREQTYSVILFSHGLHGLPSDTNVTILQELASHGYIVIGIDHPYFNDLTLSPDKKVISSVGLSSTFNAMTPQEQKQYQTDAIAVYKADVRFLIDELTKLNQDENNEFSGRLDLDRIGVMGHSAGGTAAIETCRADGRCKAAIDLDGWYDQAIGKDPIKKPLLLLFAEKSIEVIEPTQEYLERKQLTRDQYFEREEKIADHRKKLCADKECSMIIIPGIGHSDFSDSNLLKWPLRDRHLPDGYRIISLINGYIVKFLDTSLK